MSNWSLICKRTISETLRKHVYFLIVLVFASIVWSIVFHIAAIEFMMGIRPFRASWTGVGQFNLFGYTIDYYFEGWADHDYYYVTWGQQFLQGYVPYTTGFDHSVINGTEYFTPYFFPPLFVYLCAVGELISPVGIGLLITVFGFLTAFPIYGIASILSKRRDIGAISAATYLFNPLVLYHTVFQWLNPAPFVFFIFLAFYLIFRGNRLSGALVMVTAALFKQTALFMAFPLIAILIRVNLKEREIEPETVSEKDERPASDRIDLWGFAKTSLAVIIYALAISSPYLINLGKYISSIFMRIGVVDIQDFTTTPPIYRPITFAVPFIALGFPEWLTRTLNFLTVSSIGLIGGILLLFILMLFEIKDDRNINGYWRKMLFLTLLMMLWFHLWSPRGIYKYYCILLIPFFSILSTSRMCQKEWLDIRFSIIMVISPIVFGLMILVPDRNIYLLYVLMIFLFYVAHTGLGMIYGRITCRFRFPNLRRRVTQQSVP